MRLKFVCWKFSDFENLHTMGDKKSDIFKKKLAGFKTL
jgi:hypothetical protein